VITVQGLTERQRKIADILWHLNDHEAINNLIRSSTPDMARDIVTVREMIIAAALDEHTEVMEDVKDLIDHYRS
jgi:urease gamma subunit